MLDHINSFGFLGVYILFKVRRACIKTLFPENQNMGNHDLTAKESNISIYELFEVLSIPQSIDDQSAFFLNKLLDTCLGIVCNPYFIICFTEILN